MPDKQSTVETKVIVADQKEQSGELIHVNLHSLFDIIQSSHHNKLRLGHILLAIWKDRKHLEEWTNVRVGNFSSSSVRIASMDSQLLPFTLPDEQDKKTVAIIGIATGVENDYSDTHLLYFRCLVPQTTRAPI